MSSATSDVTYTSVYTDSEPGRAFWGADYEGISEGGIPRVIVLGYDGLPLQPVAPPSPDFILGPENPQTPPVPQDEDEREPLFIQSHDPNYVPEPIYPEYIPLEDDHEFPAEEQPLPPGYEDDETKDGPVDYPIDGGDDGVDDDGDSSRDDARDENEDEEDEEDEEEEEYLAPADSTTVIPADEPVFPPEQQAVIPPPPTDITAGVRITVRPQASISFPPEAEVERLMTMTTPSPSPPISLSLPSAGERLARCTDPPAHSPPLPPSYGFTAALPLPPLPPLPLSLSMPSPVDHRDDIPEFEQPPRKSKMPEERRQGIRDVGYEIRDTWVDPAEAVLEIAPITVGEVNTRVTELAELHERDTQDLYALLEDAQDSRSRISQRVDMNSHRVDLLMGDRMTFQETIWMVEEEAYASLEAWARTPDPATATEYSHSDTAPEPQRRVRQPGPAARISDHQEASGDADSHIRLQVPQFVWGTSDNILCNVKAAKPKTLMRFIELANDLMDETPHLCLKGKSDNNRRLIFIQKQPWSPQQPFKRETNVAKASYNMGHAKGILMGDPCPSTTSAISITMARAPRGATSATR
ncbi:hypothetical protein Tco_0953106 [Tanacetum coccineum]|uniref:Uncharacterized protein n=1 Tax=Tanacetum coccineum TaxID=301880 RepID=A0ABQ5DYX7_9ASTR